MPRLLGPPGTVSYRRQKRHSAIRNAAAYCNLARVPMPLASTRTATINCTPRPQGRRCTHGLTDYDQQGNIIPGIAVSWEPNKELTAWTFRLRKGVLFHNGREVDAEAVKLNIEHIKDPAIGSDWHRARSKPLSGPSPRQVHGALALESAACRRAVQRAALPDQPAGPGQL